MDIQEMEEKYTSLMLGTKPISPNQARDDRMWLEYAARQVGSQFRFVDGKWKLVREEHEKHIRRDYSPIGPDVSLALYVDGNLTTVVTAWHCHKHGLGYHRNSEDKHYASIEEIEQEMLEGK